MRRTPLSRCFRYQSAYLAAQERSVNPANNFHRPNILPHASVDPSWNHTMELTRVVQACAFKSHSEESGRAFRPDIHCP
jgi:hypothetical protein